MLINCTIYNNANNVAFMVFYYGSLYLITITNLLGNCLVLSTWFRYKRLRSPANYFIYSLAFSDLMLGGISYPVHITSHMELDAMKLAFNKWGLCWTVLVMVTSSQMASAYNLVVLTLNRYLAVIRPDVIPVLFTGRRSLVMALVIWTVSLIMATTVYVEWQPEAYPECCYLCRYEILAKGYSTLTLSIVTVLVPLIAMSALYAHLSCLTHRQVRRISDEPSLQGPEYDILRARMAKKNIALVKMAAILVGYFALSWIPLLIFLLISAFCPQCEKRIPVIVRALCRLLLHSNSAVNVFIYAGRHPEFREVFKHDLARICCCYKLDLQSQLEVTGGSRGQEQTAELKTMSQLESARVK